MMKQCLKHLAHLSLTILLFTGATNAGEKSSSDKVSRNPVALGNPKAPKSGTLKLRLENEIKTLNPIISDGHDAVQVQFYIIEPLAMRNIDTYEWDPVLATEWKVSEDGTKYDFYLREGVTWSDGTPFTAEDVKFSFEVIFNDAFPTAHMRPYYEGIKAVEILGTHHVRFTAKNKYFRNFFSAAALPIVPKHIYEDPNVGPKIHDNLIGTGPYTLKKFDRSRHIILEKNPKWWGNTDPLYRGMYNPQRVVFQFISSDTIAIEMMKKDQLDYLWLSPEMNFQLKDDPDVGKSIFIKTIENKFPQMVHGIALNLNLPIFKDRRVRYALSHLLDRQLIIDKFYHGLHSPAHGPWYQQSEFADPSVEQISFDPKKALKILREAGWRDSDNDGVLDKIIDGVKHPMSFTILTGDSGAERFLTVLKEDAKIAGVGIQIKTLGWNSLLRLLDERKYQAFYTSWGGGVVEFDPRPQWHSSSAFKGGNNFVEYKSPEVDQLINEAVNIHSFQERIPVMRKIYRKIAYDLPYIFLYNQRTTIYARSNRVGVPKPTFNYGLGLKYWWVESPSEQILERSSDELTQVHF